MTAARTKRLTPGGCQDCGVEIVNEAPRGRWKTRCPLHDAAAHRARDRARRPGTETVVNVDDVRTVSAASVAETAWLAGLWDGEGSVGMIRSKATGRLVIIPQVQISMTHLPTIERAIAILRLIGVHAIHHTLQERMNHHKDAHHVGFGRTLLVKLAAEAMLPYAVTKRRQWELAREICDLRIERQGITASGNLQRGGPQGWAKPYTDHELALVDELSALNYRAPAPVSGPVLNPRRGARPLEATS